MLNATVIVSDAEVESRSLLADVLENCLGYHVLPVAGAPQVIDCMYEKHLSPPEAVLMDVASDPLQVIHHLNQLQMRFPHLPVIALTNYGDMKQATAALEAGAIDYMSRPVSHQRLKVSIDNAVRQYRLAVEVSRLRCERATGGDLNFLPLDNVWLRRLVPQSDNANQPVLLCGETGTGKEAVAHAIHMESERSDQAFVPLNCTSFAETQLWSILFGTGGKAEGDELYSGKVIEALGGTLFLDEVQYLSVAIQRRLLAALEEIAQMAPMRHHHGKRGVRLVVATGMECDEFLQSDKLLPEFLAMVSEQVITLPPLRESVEDITALARYFTERFALQENPTIQEITPQALALLQAYDWPGNVFELERVIFRAVLLSEDTVIDTEHLLPYLPPSFMPENNHQGLQEAMMRSRRMPLTNECGEVRRLRDLEADMINFALNFYEGRISEVARKLGIGRSTLYRKLHDLDIKVA